MGVLFCPRETFKIGEHNVLSLEISIQKEFVKVNLLQKHGY